MARLQDLLSSDFASIAIPIASALLAPRAPRTVQGGLLGLGAVADLQRNRRLREEFERKRAERKQLDIGARSALEQFTAPQTVTKDKTLEELEAERGRMALRIGGEAGVDLGDVGAISRQQTETVPISPERKALGRVFEALIAGGGAKEALAGMGTQITREPKEAGSKLGKLMADRDRARKAGRPQKILDTFQARIDKLTAKEEEKPAPSPFAKIDITKFTRESRKAYQKTITKENPEGDRSALVLSETPETKGVKLTDKDRLLKQFAMESKPFVTIRDSFKRVQAAAKEPSAFGDIALVFNFMKILDPGSVVRESEFATASNAGGVPERARALYNRVLAGERLSEDMREDLVATSERLFNSQIELHLGREKQFGTFATQRGFLPEEVVQDYLGAYRTTDTKNQVGTTEDGKRVFRLQNGTIKVEE